MALADSSIEADLALDGISESVLYAAGLGARPAGAAIRSHPVDVRALTLRPNPRMNVSLARRGSRERESRLP
jgi:hypothetical protein